MYRCVDVGMSGCISVCTYVCRDEWMDVWMYGCVDA